MERRVVRTRRIVGGSGISMAMRKWVSSKFRNFGIY